jgi:hypothetical protein
MESVLFISLVLRMSAWWRCRANSTRSHVGRACAGDNSKVLGPFTLADKIMQAPRHDSPSLLHHIALL